MDVPFVFFLPALSALALVLRVAFSLGMVIAVWKLRVSGRVNWLEQVVRVANRL
jgi:hypothetical protein